MHRKFAHSPLAASLAALIASLVLAGHGVALAQDIDDDEDPIASELTDDSDDSDSSSSDSSSSSDDAGTGSGPGSLGYKMAISTTFPTGGDAAAANLLYGLNQDTFLNLNLGLNFIRGADPVTGDAATIVGLQLGAGYRMYQAPKGRIRPYIEPGLRLLFGDFGNFNETLDIFAYGNFGIDLAVTDQFTLGASIGAALRFADSFDTIAFGLNTAAINATFWW